MYFEFPYLLLRSEEDHASWASLFTTTFVVVNWLSLDLRFSKNFDSFFDKSFDPDIRTTQSFLFKLQSTFFYKFLWGHLVSPNSLKYNSGNFDENTCVLRETAPLMPSSGGSCKTV